MQLSRALFEFQFLRLPGLQRPRYNSVTSASSPPAVDSNYWQIMNVEVVTSSPDFRSANYSLLPSPQISKLIRFTTNGKWRLTWSQWRAFQTRLNQNAIMKSNENTDVFRFAPIVPNYFRTKIDSSVFLFVFPFKSVQPMEGSGEADGRKGDNHLSEDDRKAEANNREVLLRLQFSWFISLAKCLTKFSVIDVSRLWWRGRRTSYNNRNCKFRKPEVKHGVYFILFSFFFLQDWWHNPRLTTIMFRGSWDSIHKTQTKYFLSDFRTNFFHLLLLIDVSITEK